MASESYWKYETIVAWGNVDDIIQRTYESADIIQHKNKFAAKDCPPIPSDFSATEVIIQEIKSNALFERLHGVNKFIFSSGAVSQEITISSSLKRLQEVIASSLYLLRSASQ